jgi:RNA polymerase sigma factor (sigma-70 family)
MSTRREQDARHREVVRSYYETSNGALLAQVLAELHSRLVAFLRYKGLTAAEQIEDLVQETLMEAIKGLQQRKYKPTGCGTLASWANGICWHRYVDSLTSTKSCPSRPGIDEDPFLLLECKASSLPEFLSVLAEDEHRAGILLKAATHAVLGLDPNARACVLLHYYHSLTVEETATQLGIDVQKARERLRRGLFVLRRWGQKHRHLAPASELYAALRRLDSGNLFQDRGISLAG